MSDVDEAGGALEPVEPLERGLTAPPEARQEIEAVLSAFRQWLLEAEAWRLLSPAGDGPSEDGEPPMNLHALVSEWIGLKQEFRLASRGNKATREQLDQAVDAFHQGLDQVGSELQEAVQSLIRERDRLRDDLQGRIESQEKEWAELLFDVREVFARGVEASRQASRRLGWRGWFLPAAVFGGLIEGHELALRRIDAALESRGIRPIECEGLPVDPERMRVVDVVRREDMPPGRVVEVLRRGYARGGRVLRYAEVRAVAGAAAAPPEAAIDFDGT